MSSTLAHPSDLYSIMHAGLSNFIYTLFVLCGVPSTLSSRSILIGAALCQYMNAISRFKRDNTIEDRTRHVPFVL